MRDNSSGYVEILDTYEREGLYFGVVRNTKLEERAALEFGVSQAGYFALKRVLGFRPFDSMPGVKYQYSFTGSYVSTADRQQQRISFRVFVEQGGARREFEFEGPRDLLANLLWFLRLTSLAEAGHLKRIGD